VPSATVNKFTVGTTYGEELLPPPCDVQALSFRGYGCLAFVGTNSVQTEPEIVRELDTKLRQIVQHA
jgi:hypothetical protein